MITVIDYGMGNLHSVENALKHIGAECVVSSSIEDIKRADKLLLPGVGAFPDAVAALKEKVRAMAEEFPIPEEYAL